MKDISEAILTECLRYQVIPLAMENNQLVIAAVESESLNQVISELSFTCGCHIKVNYWPAMKVEQYIHRLKHSRPDGALIAVAQLQLPNDEAAEYADERHDDEPVVQFINQVIRQAFQRRASDIHFEPYAGHYRIRLRIDGTLQETAMPPAALALQLAARLKIMGRLDIAERRLPQDGQLTFNLDGEERALRISTIPVSAGEKVVLRVMESGKAPQEIASMGMPTKLQTLYTSMIHQPQGLILVTGPTGSGKTATLYAGLRLLNDASRNICSVEDPIEIPLSGMNQTQINLKAGITFSTALRAFLRQDPDILMVGEIRDRETADIAIEAAQTGHLVLATLHTNSAADTLVRLSQMGIPDYLLASSLKLIVAQRLIRCLCPRCRQKKPHDQKVYRGGKNITLHDSQAMGCEHCLSGYYGRTGIYEMLCVTDELRQALFNGATATQLHILACQQGMVPLFEAGITLVEQGITSLQELYRTIGAAHQEPEADLL
ncbi:type II secretion system protein GspE [Budvicia diplopodorum]|uniref:type II secretion system protein GspE n=1 Tax=Budvicia diplopodorum TaxID=1119056 RepID=UPI0013588716|nr:type II secretion system protein GspE [Budvicia diplopodorum]